MYMLCILFEYSNWLPVRTDVVELSCYRVGKDGMLYTNIYLRCDGISLSYFKD